MNIARRCVTAAALAATAMLSTCAAASASERERLGPQGVVELDPGTGTPRVIARTDGTLTAPPGADAEGIARGYVRAHLPAFGLTATDLDGLRLTERRRTTGGVEILRFRQSIHG